MTDNAPSTQQKPEVASSQWRDRFREFAAVLFWLYVVSKLFVFDIDVFLLDRYSPSWRHLYNFKFFILSCAVAISLLIFRRPSSRFFFIYVASYPFIILLWWLPVLVFRNWPWAVAFAPAVHEFYQSFRSTFAMYSFSALSALLILTSDTSWVLMPSMAFLGVFLSVHLFRSTRKAYRSSVFSGLTELLREIRSKIEAKVGAFDLWKAAESKPDTPKVNAQYDTHLTLYYYSNFASAYVAEQLEGVAKSRRVDLYLIATWLWTCGVVIITFSFEYFSLQKIVPTAFDPAGHGYWRYLGFSFEKLIPSGISSLSPIHPFAIGLCYMQSACTFLVLIIMVFIILTSARERYREDLDSFIGELRQTTSAIESQFAAAYSLALTDVELYLVIKQAPMVNYVRKLRGFPELAPPIQPESAPAVSKIE